MFPISGRHSIYSAFFAFACIFREKGKELRFTDQIIFRRLRPELNLGWFFINYLPVNKLGESKIYYDIIPKRPPEGAFGMDFWTILFSEWVLLWKLIAPLCQRQWPIEAIRRHI